MCVCVWGGIVLAAALWRLGESVIGSAGVGVPYSSLYRRRAAGSCEVRGVRAPNATTASESRWLTVQSRHPNQINLVFFFP